MEGLESFDGFHSSIHVRVVAFAHVVGGGAVVHRLIEEEFFFVRLDVREDGFKEQVAFGMDVVDMCEADHTLLMILWEMEDVLHHGVEEMAIGGIGANLERLPYVLKVMGVAELNLGFREHAQKG